MTDDDEIAPVPVVYPMMLEPSPDLAIPYSGRIEVLTESGSRYLLDLDLELLTRYRGTEQPDNPDVAFPSKLRDHGRTIRLLRVVRAPEVGKRMVVDVESLSTNPDVAFTRRATTYVVAVRQLPATEPDHGRHER